MKKSLYILFSLFLTLVACQEREEASEYDNWQERNAHYLDSIADAARQGNGWTMFKSYNMGDELDLNGDNNHYIYVKKLENGSGTEHPLFNDSVRVHYTGHLIPSASYPDGFCFDKSFKGNTLNTATDVPSIFGVNSVVKGFSTALMHMVEGDRWKVVIPYYLGYGSNGSTTSGIPAYSTLVFEIHLARIYHYQKDTNTKWY